MRSREVEVPRATEGEVCLDAGQSARVSVSVPSRARFDRPLLAPGVLCRCPGRSKVRCWPRNPGDLANVGSHHSWTRSTTWNLAVSLRAKSFTSTAARAPPTDLARQRLRSGLLIVQPSQGDLEWRHLLPPPRTQQTLSVRHRLRITGRQQWTASTSSIAKRVPRTDLQ